MGVSGDALTGSVASANLAQAVVLKGNESTPLPVTIGGTTGNATSTVTRVAANAANVTLLAANANRHGATICNHSIKTLYIKLGATANIGAGTESFTVILVPVDATNDIGGYYEVPFNYTGRIDGIWSAADANGEALVDEITA